MSEPSDRGPGETRSAGSTSSGRSVATALGPPRGRYLFDVERDVPSIEQQGMRHVKYTLTVEDGDDRASAALRWETDGTVFSEHHVYSAREVRLSRIDSNLTPCRYSSPLLILELPLKGGASWKGSAVCLQTKQLVETSSVVVGVETVEAGGERVRATRVDTRRKTTYPDGRTKEVEWSNWYDDDLLVVKRVTRFGSASGGTPQTHYWTMTARHHAPGA